MSFFELLIILIVGVIFLDYDDIFLIIKKIKQLKNYVSSIYYEVHSYINDETDTNLREMKNEVDEINHLLKEITKLGEEYKGDYALKNIKSYYKRLKTKSQYLKK